MSADELDAADRRELLRLARRAIEACLTRRDQPVRDLPSSFRDRRGAFVTLRRRADGELRGCIGYVEALFPLAETVSRAAIAAATEDNRFLPVTLAELPALCLDISVLNPPHPVRAEDVEVGRHGLIVRRGGRSGLLLPQVPGEYGWDRQTFLEHTCLKAGLPVDAWQLPDTQILAFTATVFSDEDGGSRD